MPAATLTDDETDLLEWLSKEDWSYYCECYGHTLHELRRKGLVEIVGWPKPVSNSGVRLTVDGLDALKNFRATKNAP